MKNEISLSKKPYRGTRDFFPQDKRKQNYLFDKMKKVSHLFGYEPYDGPLLEEVELYKAKSGEELINEQIYSFTDRGERFVAIRPEMTPTLARMISSIHKEVPKPIRWFSIPNLMRYEKPQRGRLREHWQFNCDIFGAPQLQGEIEIISLLIHLFSEFGANENHFEILVNDRNFVDVVFNELLNANSPELSYKLYKSIDRSRKIPKEALHKEIQNNGLSENQCTTFFEYLAINSTTELKIFLEKHGITQKAEHLLQFLSELEILDLAKFVKFDATIVRGLDYYTGIVFEAFDKHPDNRRALCGGGSYANLLKIFGEDPLPGVGVGLGDVTLTDFLEVHNLMPKFEQGETTLYLSFQQEAAKNICFKLANKLRKKDISVATTLVPTKINKVFPLAEKAGAKFVGIIDSKELEANHVQIKNLQTKEQFTISIDMIDADIENLRIKMV